MEPKAPKPPYAGLEVPQDEVTDFFEGMASDDIAAIEAYLETYRTFSKESILAGEHADFFAANISNGRIFANLSDLPPFARQARALDHDKFIPIVLARLRRFRESKVDEFLADAARGQLPTLRNLLDIMGRDETTFADGRRRFLIRHAEMEPVFVALEERVGQLFAGRQLSRLEISALLSAKLPAGTAIVEEVVPSQGQVGNAPEATATDAPQVEVECLDAVGEYDLAALGLTAADLEGPQIPRKGPAPGSEGQDAFSSAPLADEPVSPWAQPLAFPTSQAPAPAYDPKDEPTVPKIAATGFVGPTEVDATWGPWAGGARLRAAASVSSASAAPAPAASSVSVDAPGVAAGLDRRMGALGERAVVIGPAPARPAGLSDAASAELARPPKEREILDMRGFLERLSSPEGAGDIGMLLEYFTHNRTTLHAGDCDVLLGVHKIAFLSLLHQLEVLVEEGRVSDPKYSQADIEKLVLAKVRSLAPEAVSEDRPDDVETFLRGLDDQKRQLLTEYLLIKGESDLEFDTNVHAFLIGKTGSAKDIAIDHVARIEGFRATRSLLKTRANYFFLGRSRREVGRRLEIKDDIDRFLDALSEIERMILVRFLQAQNMDVENSEKDLPGCGPNVHELAKKMRALAAQFKLPYDPFRFLLLGRLGESLLPKETLQAASPPREHDPARDLSTVVVRPGEGGLFAALSRALKKNR